LNDPGKGQEKVLEDDHLQGKELLLYPGRGFKPLTGIGKGVKNGNISACVR